MANTTVEDKKQKSKRLWTEEEDRILTNYVNVHGKGQWNRLAKKTGLKRCGKSCRLRWMNYLCPDVNRGDFTEQEDDLIIRLHKLLGNRWSLIAKRVPGRTDNQVKNYWNTHLNKKLQAFKQQNGNLGILEHRTRGEDASTSASFGGSVTAATDSSSRPCIQCSTSAEAAPDQSKEVSARAQVESLLIKEAYVDSLSIPDDVLELSEFGCLDFLDGYDFDLV